MSDDRYPTEEELTAVETWDTADPAGWLGYISTLWWAADWGWREMPVAEEAFTRRPYQAFHVSTGGWSGNEEIISAMQRNRWLWAQIIYGWRIGGHYEFRLQLPLRDTEAKPTPPATREAADGGGA
ncbi:MAG TPA: hypothetical protein VEA38_25510 [Terriglobales bacterium]|nr:hypothetical protein [Terriglobales bacterium]